MVEAFGQDRFVGARVFSKSANVWIDNPVVKLVEGGLARVEYDVNGAWCGKTMQRCSENLEIPAHALSALEEAETIVSLLNRGITLRQMLVVFSELQELGRMCQDMKTWEVVRDIVIPDTAEEACSFMQSECMRIRGGGRQPDKLLSHWWGAAVSDTILAMAQDATGWPPCKSQSCFDSGTLLHTLECSEAFRELDAAYWWCVFAVNQHASICGTAWNPCSCGSRKFMPGHPKCEMDKFEKVMAQIPGGVAVALDPTFGALERVWCLAEISTVLHLDMPILFRLSRGMSEEVQADVAAGKNVVPRVEEAKASVEEDRVRILHSIESTMGYNRFNQEMRVLFEMQGPGVNGYQAWRQTQMPAPCRELQDRYFNELSSLERGGWREREIAAFDRTKYLNALEDPKRFEFQYVGMNGVPKHIVGVRVHWGVAKRKFNFPNCPPEFDGDLLPGMTVYETIGPGPKLFGVVAGSDAIYYHDRGKWQAYASGVPLARPQGHKFK